MTALMTLARGADENDLLELHDWLQHRFDPNRARPFSDDEHTLWRIMGETLRAHSATHIPPLGVFVRVPGVGRQRYSDAVDNVNSFLDQSCGTELRLIERQAVLRSCLDCLAARLVKRNIPVSPRSMFLNLGLLHAAVEDAFPGYAANRMLQHVVTMRR